MRPGKELAAMAAAALVCAGCGEKEYIDREAVAFGYRGEDVKSTNMLYLAVSPTVTNWVPERVLAVFERYEWTKDELALLKDSGTTTPGAYYDALPAGFTRDKEMDGPWYTYWVKDAEAFGEKGTAGTIGHFDEDKKKWETGESYFSSYWKTAEEAEAALARLETTIVSNYHPKKVYKFPGTFVAEYTRLCAVAVVGARADGKRVCMLNLRDKCEIGCGNWEDVASQKERLERYRYSKALEKWRADSKAAAEANHAAVEKAMDEKGLSGFSDGAEKQDAGDGRRVAIVQGTEAEGEPQAIWDAAADRAIKAYGAKLKGGPVKQAIDAAGGQWWSAEWESDTHEGRVDAAFPGAGEDGVKQPAQWRAIAIEKLLPGFALPAKPEKPESRAEGASAK